MKKLLTIALALMMVLSLAACGNNDTPDPSGGTNDPGSSQQTPSGTSNPSENPESDDRFTEFGLSLEKVQPEGNTKKEVATDSKRTYAVNFTMPEAVTGEAKLAYYKKIYDLTASVSEGGTNYKKTGGTEISPEVSPMGAWEDENSETMPMNDWFYKYNGKLYNVVVFAGVDDAKEVSISIYDFS